MKKGQTSTGPAPRSVAIFRDENDELNGQI